MVARTELRLAGLWEFPKECHLETSLAVSMAKKTAGGWVERRAAKTAVLKVDHLVGEMAVLSESRKAAKLVEMMGGQVVDATAAHLVGDSVVSTAALWDVWTAVHWAVLLVSRMDVHSADKTDSLSAANKVEYSD